jgi:hypothetical protein
MDEIAEAARAWADENYRHQRVAACDGFEAGAKWALERAAKDVAALNGRHTGDYLEGSRYMRDHVLRIIRRLLPAPVAKEG